MPRRPKQVSLSPRNTDPIRSEANSFYGSVRWRRLRALVLAEQPLCGECEEMPAEMVHHILERNNRPDLELERSNLVALCHACHNRIHKSSRRYWR